MELLGPKRGKTHAMDCFLCSQPFLRRAKPTAPNVPPPGDQRNPNTTLSLHFPCPLDPAATVAA